MEIRIGSRTRRRAVIDTITDNGVFGLSALSNIPVNTMFATVVENSRLLSFNGQSLHKLCNEETELGYKVMQELVTLVIERLSHAKRTLAHVLSVTSHDLRAPLATVQSSLDALLGGFVGDISIKQRELLYGGRQRIIDLMSMIDNILDISYIEIRATDFKRVNLADVAASSISDVDNLAKQKGIVIRSNVPKELHNILGLPMRLRQVLTNLLSNAVKFTPGGGLVTVNSNETAEKIQLEVSDTGVGISPDELPKIFADFYRGMKVEAEGVGLGLAIAKKIVEAHGGTIWVESPDPETGKGTRFSFTIPKVLEAVDYPEEGRKHVAAAKILVADDDPEMRKITALLLKSQGYQVYTAQDGEEVLAIIRKEEPDLLILDLLMPNLDGFEVCKQLEERRVRGGKKIPVLIFSAVREESSRRRYELETETELDVEDYITKPISPPVLLQRVEKVLMKQEALGVDKLAATKGGKSGKTK
jgi:signal transduction histidine kinase/CheY-like chemotaxis protein